MSPERWQHIQNLYFTAVELEPAERTPFLERECGGDVATRREVESLLECETKVGKFLDQTAIEVVVKTYGVDTTTSPDPELSDSLVGMVIDDRYIVREHIGSGGMGDVYRAEHRLLGTSVAVKRLASKLRSEIDYRERFVEEARRAVSLDHENVAHVKDVVETANEVFVVMEFIDGQTLRRRLDRSFGFEEFLDVAIQCSSALAAAHRQRIVHLDIKPENIMLTSSQKVKVCDFGLARQLSTSEQDRDTEPASRWVFGGTPSYMAPEVLMSNRFDERADVFSLGVVFHEMLAGQHPFRSKDVRTTTNRIVQEAAPPLSKKYPSRLVRLIDTMLAKDPEKRLSSAGEVVRELQIIRRHRRFFSDAWQSAREMVAQVARRPLAASAVVTVLLSAIVGIVYLSTAAPLPERKIVAVLPFRVIGDNSNERFYSEGVSEILTSKLVELTGVPDLQVVPSGAIRESGVNSIEMARAEFGATLVLEGTFQFSGDQVRVSYALINAMNRRQLRTGSQTVRVADPFALEDVVIKDVLKMLQVELVPAELQTLQAYGTRNLKAFFLYTEGLGALGSYHEPESVERAINVFSQAVSEDDQYAAGHAALGRAYWQKFSATRQPAWLNQATVACEKAVSLDRQLSEAQVCLGRVHEEKGDYELAIEYYERGIECSHSNDDAYRGLGSILEKLQRYDEAEKAYLRAIELKPGWASESWIASFYNSRYEFGKAIDHFYKALALSPDNAQVYYSLAVAFTNVGQYDEAIKLLKKSAQLRPYRAPPHSNLGVVYLRARRYAEAVDALEKAASLQADYRITGNLARAYWLAGRPDEARQKYELAIQQGQELLQVRSLDHAVHILLGRYHAMLGRTPEALSHINLAFSLHRNDPHYLTIAATAYVRLGDRGNALSLMEEAVKFGYTSVQIRAEPELDVLESDPRYGALMSSVVKDK